jgi:hypothetical protein
LKPEAYIDRPTNVGGMQRVGSAFEKLCHVLKGFEQEKLSEEALVAKMEAMKLHNAKLQAQREVCSLSRSLPY